MRILITGATGFIGERLAKQLLVKGHDIVCLVRKTSKVDSLREAGIPLVEGDITDAAGLYRIFRDVNPEVVFHSAAKVMEKDEKKLHKANVDGTRNVCRASRDHDIDKLIYVSSVAVISGNQQGMLTDSLPYKATNAYGRSKIEAERLVMDFRRGGLRVAVIRPCVVYGEDEPHAFDNILKNIFRRCIPLPDMPQTAANLQLVYVGNVVKILELALDKEESLEGTFIVADREIITMKIFLETLYKETGSGSPPIVPRWVTKAVMSIPPVKKWAENFFKDRMYDISRACDILGYDPEISTEEGLHRTVEYWKENNCK